MNQKWNHQFVYHNSSNYALIKRTFFIPTEGFWVASFGRGWQGADDIVLTAKLVIHVMGRRVTSFACVHTLGTPIWHEQ